MKVTFNNKPIREQINYDDWTVSLDNCEDKLLCEHTRDEKKLNLVNLQDNKSLKVEEQIFINDEPVVNLLCILMTLNIELQGFGLNKDNYNIEFAGVNASISQLVRQNGMLYYCIQFTDKE